MNIRISHSLFCVIVFMCMMSISVAAQDTTNIGQRLELAKQMHTIRPTKDQVNDAINRMAGQLPQDARAEFTSSIKKALNYDAIEKLSVEAMAETFTEKELKSMVEYYSKPEAISASNKEQQYRAQIMPEIIKMLDKAVSEAAN